MPQNRRPPGWLPNGDPDWDGTTVAERRHAQNTYDLLVEQEKANELAKEKLQQDRENAEKIAKTVKEAEEDRFENELYIQQQQNELDKEMRYHKLCDELGLNYDEIKKLSLWVNQPTNEQLNMLYEAEKRYNNFFIKNDNIKKLTQEKQELQNKYKDTKSNIKELNININNSHYYQVDGIKDIKGGKEKSLKKHIQKNKKKITHFTFYIFLITTIAIGLGLLNNKFMLISLIFGAILDLIIYIPLKKYKKEIKLISQAIEHGKNEIKSNDNANEKNKKMLNAISKQLNDLDYKIQDAKDTQIKNELQYNDEYCETEKEKNNILNHINSKNGYSFNGELFNDFRKKHYNSDVERLFRKLEIKNFAHILEDEIISNGTIDDYNKFIEKIIFNIDSIYFEDYKSYLKLGIKENLPKLEQNETKELPIENLSNFLVYNAETDFEKYVFNNIILKSNPNEHKVIIIDIYSNNISKIYDQHTDYLYLPIINDIKKAIGVQSWASIEIQERKNNFKELNVSNIDEYNNISDEKTPNITIIIDNIGKIIKQISKDNWLEFQDNLKHLCYNTEEKYGMKIIATMEENINNSDLKGFEELFTVISEEEFKKLQIQ